MYYLVASPLDHNNTSSWAEKNYKVRLFHLVLQFSHFWSVACFWASLVCSELPFLAGPALPPITDHLPHDSHSHTVQRLTQSHSVKIAEKRLFSQGHQPEDLPNPDRDEHVGQPVEPVRQKRFGLRIPRILE